jgi:glutamate 5-kinase
VRALQIGVAAQKRALSLLRTGVSAVEGSFERGDAVLVHPDGTPVAKHLAAFDGAVAKGLVGNRTGEIEAILGYHGRSDIVHRVYCVSLRCRVRLQHIFFANNAPIADLQR